jgi:hypothetical protein
MIFLDNKWLGWEYIFANWLLFLSFWLINIGMENKCAFWKIKPLKWRIFFDFG